MTITLSEGGEKPVQGDRRGDLCWVLDLGLCPTNQLDAPFAHKYLVANIGHDCRHITWAAISMLQDAFLWNEQC